MYDNVTGIKVKNKGLQAEPASQACDQWDYKVPGIYNSVGLIIFTPLFWNSLLYEQETLQITMPVLAANTLYKH